MGDTDLSWSVWVLEEGQFGGVEVTKMCHFLNKNTKKANKWTRETDSEWKVRSILNTEQETEEMTRLPWEVDNRISVGKALWASYVDSDKP